MSISQKTVASVLDGLLSEHRSVDFFVSVSFDGETFFVRFETGKVPKSAQGRKIFLVDDETNDIRPFELVYEEGPKITAALGYVSERELVEPLPPILSIKGGIEIISKRDTSKYGTLGIIVRSVSFSGSGYCSFSCTTNNAMMSNNHVIALSDTGQRGDRLENPFWGEIGSLQCWIPLSCRSDSDYASGEADANPNVVFGEIERIGTIWGFRRPGRENIRKMGARTQLTNGRVTRQTHISADGHLYRNVFETTGGFGCGGDSGSIVVGDDNRALGMYSWGDDIPCDQNPRGYFYTFNGTGRLAMSGNSISRFDFDLGLQNPSV